jgi:hypothetical protein
LTISLSERHGLLLIISAAEAHPFSGSAGRDGKGAHTIPEKTL